MWRIGGDAGGLGGRVGACFGNFTDDRIRVGVTKFGNVTSVCRTLVCVVASMERQSMMSLFTIIRSHRIAWTKEASRLIHPAVLLDGKGRDALLGFLLMAMDMICYSPKEGYSANCGL